MNKNNEKIQCSQIINTYSPDAVIEEVKFNFILNYPVRKFISMRKIFSITKKLFKGDFPGYRKCDTPYHNINHAFDVLLALSRIIDGYNISEKKLDVEKVKSALTASLFHDCGYIVKSGSPANTGAEYMKDHEKRSIDFIRENLAGKVLSMKNAGAVCRMIECTDINRKIEDINFKDEQEKLLAGMLASADYIGQMSSRTYLERLLSLYKEFKQSDLSVYESEYELLKKTVDFYRKTVLSRLDNDFSGVYKYARVHFRERYNVDSPLYVEAIENQIQYLDSIMRKHPDEYRKKLRRRECGQE